VLLAPFVHHLHNLHLHLHLISRRIIPAVPDLQLMTMAGPPERIVPVDFDANIIHRGRDGSVVNIPYEKEFMLPAGDIERAITDQRHRSLILSNMLRQSHTEMLSLRPSWHCYSCRGDFLKFCPFPSGLGGTDENGRVPCSVYLFPVCSDGKCATSATHVFNSKLAGAAKATGTDYHPDRGVPYCRQCRKSDDASERFSKCSRCKVSYYCSRDCQRNHWAIHKKECVPAPH
jgi:hypothetical protein